MSKINHIKDATNALVDLNTFATVVTILEGGHLYSWKSQAAAQRIINICKTEQQKRLNEYDRAVLKARMKVKAGK